MANLPEKIEVIIAIPIITRMALSEGKAVLEIKADTPAADVGDFVLKLKDLCDEYDYELGEPTVEDDPRPPKATVFYLCDGMACKECNGECRHTSNIAHAKNFTNALDGRKVNDAHGAAGYFEKPIRRSKSRSDAAHKA